jgi:hypothetical protein
LQGIITNKEKLRAYNCQICRRSSKQANIGELLKGKGVVEFYEIFNIDWHGCRRNIHICEPCLTDLRKPLEIVEKDDSGTHKKVIRTV